MSFSFFFFNDTATTEIYTLSLHDALPISHGKRRCPRTCSACSRRSRRRARERTAGRRDRKSTRLNSSHSQISYAVFCLKKKKLTYEGRLGEEFSNVIITVTDKPVVHTVVD